MDELITVSLEGISIPNEASAQALIATEVKFQCLAINFNTLVRNTVGSIKAPSVKDIGVIVAQLRKDVDYFQALARGTLQCELILFMLDGKYYRKMDGMANVEYRVVRDGTKMQQIEEIQLRSIKSFMLLHKDVVIKGEHPFYKKPQLKGALISHVVMDLIPCHENVTLVESHTGAFKSVPQWSSKLNIRAEDRGIIPFNSITLNLFGDKYFVKPADKRLSIQVYDVAEKSHWNASTTRERVLFTLAQKASDVYELINANGY